MGFQRKQVSAENALVRLETLCSRSEHCEWELREKLRGWNVAVSDAAAILVSLAKHRFYDDGRFARAYVRDKLVYSHWGRRKIAMGLYAKRIDRELINEALDGIDAEEYAGVLRAFLQGKCRSITGQNAYERRTKLYRAGVSRGFEPELVAKMLRSGAVRDDAQE